jgi:hypothetical protein
MVNARPKGTPAASKLDNKRVKFSNIRGVILLEFPNEKDFPAPVGAAAGALPLATGSFGAVRDAAGFELAAGALPLRSFNLMGRNPRPSN